MAKVGAKSNPIAPIIGIGLLGWALVPSNPYGYYLLLRVVVCGICAYLAFVAYDRHQHGLAWILGITAVVYNPFIHTHLNRGTWSIVNIATMVLLAVTIWAFRPRPTPPAHLN